MTTPTQPRTRDDVLTDAIRILTEAARLTHTVGDGTDAERTIPAGFAEFLTLAVAGAAANAGGIETLLAGRPGSWEADWVRTMLVSTVGADEDHLPEHRTDPIVVPLDVEAILFDLTDGQWDAAWAAREERADAACGAAYDAARAAHADHPLVVPDDVRDTVDNIFGQASEPTSEQLAVFEALKTEHEFLLSVSPALAAADAAVDAVGDARDAQETAYSDALLAAMQAEARRLGYTVPVIATTTAGTGSDVFGLEFQLEEVARATVPVPSVPTDEHDGPSA